MVPATVMTLEILLADDHSSYRLKDLDDKTVVLEITEIARVNGKGRPGLTPNAVGNFGNHSRPTHIIRNDT